MDVKTKKITGEKKLDWAILINKVYKGSSSEYSLPRLVIT